MARKHPQNGPSFSKATYKPKSLTDEELAAFQARKRDREAETVKDAECSRAFALAVKKRGFIPLSGPGAAEFWDSLPKKPKNSN